MKDLELIKKIFDNLLETDYELGKDTEYCDECDSDIDECICEDQGSIEEEELEDGDPLKKGFSITIIKEIKDPFKEEE